MRISFISGVCVKNDAISNSIRDQVELLASRGVGDVRLFAYECDHAQLPFRKVEGVTDVAFDPHFISSDLVLFHFGIYYPLFDLLAAVPRRTRRVVFFHNITPKEHLPDSIHETIDRSFKQLGNIAWADHVICASETNLNVLRQHGIDTPASVIPISVPCRAAPSEKPSFSDGIVRVLFIGRFVRSKGPAELLEAIGRALAAGVRGRIQVDLVGNLVFSDHHLVADLRDKAAKLEREHTDAVRIQFHGNATEPRKWQLLGEADLFVLPTYHEGFCVPIVEALASGDVVLAYDNSNTPAVAGGLASLVPTGDIDALATALTAAIGRVRSAEWKSSSYREHARRSRQHVEQFDPLRVEEQFLNVIQRVSA